MKWNLCNRGIKYATAELEKYEEDYMQKIITNGIIVLEDQMLQDNDVVIENDRITGIRRTGDTDKTGSREIYDAGGAYIMPGIIDIHSDMIETYIQPRSTAVMDFEMALGGSGAGAGCLAVSRQCFTLYPCSETVPGT